MSGSSTTGLDERTAAVLCYSAWWMTGGLFLLLERQHRTVRFHAAQSVVLFGAMSVLLVGLGVSSAMALLVSGRIYQLLRVTADVLWVGSAVLWLALVVRAWRGDVWRVPLVAALADRLVERTSW